MSETRQTSDLRDRMERIATKPIAQRRVATPRAMPPLRRVRTGARRRPGPARAPRAGNSRLRTLRAWGSWELITVPAQRWKWLAALLRGR
jgi:hypothetical protein